MKTYLVVSDDWRDGEQLRPLADARDVKLLSVPTSHAEQALARFDVDGVLVRVEPGTTGAQGWMQALTRERGVPVIAIARGSAGARVAAGVALASGASSVVRLDGLTASVLGRHLAQAAGRCETALDAVG